IQGLTLPAFIKNSGVFDFITDEPEHIAKQKLKQGLRAHIYKFLKEKYNNEMQDHVGMQKLLSHWEEKIKASDDDWMNEKTKAIFLEMLNVQRQYLDEYNKDVTVDEDIIRMQLYQIDMEEERLRML
ncbi:MAG: Na+/H+ antiporter, partial [Bacteroidetes bacterium]|nr:Na+/H+ antiporter [Bacteroidota bacterium]